MHIALKRGARGLSTRCTLPQLLTEHRGVRNHLRQPRLSKKVILGWADAHYARTGCWPTAKAGTIAESPSEDWYHVDVALRAGGRGLIGRSSLARLLAAARGVRNRKGLPRLTVARILVWADAHFKRTGSWPTHDSGRIPEASAGDTWAIIDAALSKRLRGLRVSASLPQLLEKHRGVRNRKHLQPLRVTQILGWADAYHARTGRWPHEKSGPVPEAPGETWGGINAALREGYRGFRGGSTLFRLLCKYRKVIHPPKTLSRVAAHFPA